MTSLEDTDEALAARVQAGEVDIFGMLIERYQKKLSRYGTKFLSQPEDIQDIMQEVFIRAYQNIQSFDVSQRFSPWIYRIAHNEYVSALRKRSHNPFIVFDFDALLSHHAYDDPAEGERDQADMRVMIEKGLAEISAKYREVLILYYLEEFGYKEISEVLRIPIGTVGIRLARGKTELERVYKKMNYELYV